MAQNEGGSWVRFFPNEWLVGTRGMTGAEIAIYITAVAMIYERGEPIPGERLTYRTCGLSPSTFQIGLGKLIGNGKLNRAADGTLSNRKSLEELARRKTIRDSYSSRGDFLTKQKPNGINGPVSKQPPSIGQSQNKTQTPKREASASHVEKAAIAAYSTLARKIGLADIRDLSQTRKRKLRAILSRHGLDLWTEALAKIEASRFCRGEGPRGWKAGFDFLIQPSTFVKLLEGAYDDSKKPSAAGTLFDRPGEDDFSRELSKITKGAKGG